jgi:predicted permease
MANLVRNLRYGLRSLRANLPVTLVILAVLGIGIGANVAMFTVADAAFLRPLRFPEPERLVQLQESPPAGYYMPVSYPNFLDWQKQARSFEALGIAGVWEETLRRAGSNERIPVAYVSEGFFRAYRVPPVLGRTISAADDQTGAAPVAVLSYRLWQTRFGADPGVVGRTVILDHQVWTIAGVMTPFRWNRTADVFLPIAFAQGKYGLSLRENHSSTGVIARLKPGVTLEQARAEMKVIAARLARQYPDSNGGHSAVVVPLREFIGGDMRHAVLLMSGAVALVLLIACANVAGLLLARGAVRRRELAIRTALGATRLELVRQLLAESLLLSLGGAAAGVAFAALSLTGIERIFPAAESLGGIGVDARVLAFAVLAAMVTAVLFGLAPALQFTRANVTDAIKAGGRGSRGGAVRVRTRKALVVAQVALAVVLSVGAGLLMRSLLEVLKTDPGFEPERIVSAPILPSDREDADLAQNARLVREVADRLEAMPGVEAAGATSNLPFDNPDSWAQFYRDDRPVPAGGKLPNGMQTVVTPGYFRAMGIPLLKGRLFNASDGQMPPLKRDFPTVLAYLRSTEMVAVINDTMARRYWPDEDPLGKGFHYGPPSLKGPHVRIVGVVGNARQSGLDTPVEAQYFFYAEQFPILDARLVVRTTRGAAALAPAIRGIVAQSQPDAVVTRVETLATLIGHSVAGRQDNVLLLGLFSGIALLLAALGLYGTMAYMVAQRTQEIGLRMALGAEASNVLGMVVKEGAVLGVVGVVIGIAVALAGARVVSSMLYGVTTTDTAAYAGSALLLGIVVLAASYLPAWRASRVDPMQALRAE